MAVATVSATSESEVASERSTLAAVFSVPSTLIFREPSVISFSAASVVEISPPRIQAATASSMRRAITSARGAACWFCTPVKYCCANCVSSASGPKSAETSAVDVKTTAGVSAGRSAFLVSKSPFVSRSLAPPLITRGETATMREAGKDMRLPPIKKRPFGRFLKFVKLTNRDQAEI